MSRKTTVVALALLLALGLALLLDEGDRTPADLFLSQSPGRPASWPTSAWPPCSCSPCPGS